MPLRKVSSITLPSLLTMLSIMERMKSLSAGRPTSAVSY